MALMEIDYYTMRDADGSRSNVRTCRIEIPDGTDDVRLPFILTSKIGKHEGIRRARKVDDIPTTHPALITRVEPSGKVYKRRNFSRINPED